MSEHARSSYRGVLTAFLVTLFVKAPAAGNLISRNAQYRQHLAIQDLVHLAPERQTPMAAGGPGPRRKRVRPIAARPPAAV